MLAECKQLELRDIDKAIITSSALVMVLQWLKTHRVERLEYTKYA